MRLWGGFGCVADDGCVIAARPAVPARLLLALSAVRGYAMIIR